MIKTLKKEDIDLSEWEFEFQQRGEQPILLCDFFCRSLDRYLIGTVTGKPEHCNYLFTDSDKGYDHPPHQQLVAQTLAKQIADRAALKRILRDSIEVPKSFNAVADILAKEIADENISNKKLAQRWKEMDDSFVKVIPWFYYPYYISRENLLSDRVKNGLEKYREPIGKICDFDEALLAVIFPVKKTNFQLEQEEMLGLVETAEHNADFTNNSKFKEKAREYLKKYDWLTTFILTPLLPMTYDQLVERVQRAIKESFKETFELQKKTTQKNEKLAEQILSIVKNDVVLTEDIIDCRELGYVLTAGVEEAYISSARYLPFMQLVAKRIDVAFEDTKYLMVHEIVDALENDKSIPAEVVNERKQGFVMMMRNGEQSALFGPEAHEISAWIDTELNKVDETIRELKGQTACKGFAIGKVRIALQPSQAHLLEEGEILVCPMTNPDYVPAMRRSAAIVTDEGGLLSHAAIMSREFGKPCVIATKIATQVLKTGDLIEVNANEGVIKILNKED